MIVLFSFLMADRTEWQHPLYEHNFTQNIVDLVYRVEFIPHI